MNYFKYVDLTLLKPESTKKEIKDLVILAKKHKVAGVCIHPYWVKEVYKSLKDKGIEVVTVVGFPLGMQTLSQKINETKQALKDGATEIDMVINVSQVKDKKYVELQKEISSLKKVCGKKVLKVIIETAKLTDEEIEKVSKTCVKAGADFVKTSTGFASRGATVQDVEIIKFAVKNKALIKASGGIKTKQDFINLVEAGAHRIGTSSISYLIDETAENSGY